MIRNKLKNIVFILPFLLFACPNPQSNDSNSKNIYDIDNIMTQKKGILNINVKDGLNKQNIFNAQAKIILSDGTILSKNTDNNGNAVFDSLIENNSYNIEVSANGYINNSISTGNSNLVIKSNSPSSLEIKLYKTLGTFSGKVVSEQGNPIEAAIVQVGNDISLSDIDGNFKVNVSSLDKQNVFISKIGYQNLNYGTIDFNVNNKDQNLGNIKILSKKEKLSVVFDSSKSPFGKQNLISFDDFINYTNELNYSFSYESFLSKKDFNNVDILIIASPSKNYSDEEVQKIINFIKQGKKLIVLAEWGGYSNFKIDSINKMIIQANLKINPDIIKENISTSTSYDGEQIISINISPHFITNDISKLGFYSTSSVEITNGGLRSIDSNISKLLASSSKNGFRIQTYNNGQFSIIGSSVLGLGKVIVFGDSSIFMSEDSNNNNILNINEYDNKKIIKNLFSW